MASGLSWVRVVPLVALLWGLPAEVRAELFEQTSVDGKVERLKTVRLQPLSRPMQLPLVKQAGTAKQNDAMQDVLIEVEGARTEGDAHLDDESPYDLYLFDGSSDEAALRRAELKAEADRLLQQGNDSLQISQYRRALESWQAALEIYLGLGDRRGEVDSLGNLGLAYRSLGEYRRAIDFHEQSLAIARENDDRQGEANALGNLGLAYRRLGDYQRAIDFHKQSLAIKRENDDRRGEASSLGNLGAVYYSLGEYQRAIDLHQQSLAISREIDDRQGEAASLGNLGSTYDSLGEYQRAIDLHQQSLAISREIDDRQGEANSLGSLGSTYNSLGKHQRAVDLHQQSLAISREIDDRQGEAISLGNLGLSYDSLGEYQRAIDFQQQSLAIKREIDDRQGEAISLGNLGSTYDSLGEYQRAIDFQQQSLEIAKKIGDRRGEANSLGNLGNAYRSLGKYQRAIDFYQQSLEIAKKIGDRQGEANSLGNLGVAYDSLEEYQRAIDSHQQYLEIAREISDRQGEAISLSNLGLAYNSLGEYQRAIDFYQQSLEISREIGYRQGEAISLGNLGLSYFKHEQTILAEESLLGSISLFESLRSSELSDRDRITFFETQAQTYKNLQLVLTSQNKISEALEVSDRGRARSFVQLVSEKLSAGSEAQVEANPLSFSEMQKVAEEQESVLVEYLIVSTIEGNPLLYIWVMQPTGELNFRQVSLGNDPARLSELVNQSRKSIGVRGRGLALSRAEDVNASDKLRELHQLMIEPIADLLPSDPEQRVVFIPQGDLFLVPFPALIDESGTYLIKQHTLLTAPSIQVLSLTRQQANAHASSSKSDTNLLAVGNPVMPEVWNPETAVTAQLPSLLGAEQEAQAIASLFDTEALLGANATEATVKQRIGNARIIHLATHGLLEYGTPEDSGVRDVPGAIALAPSQNEDGLLTSAEILALTLQAELVVLSACDTGLGTITGDGIIGLSRSLIAAGASSVIVSLWSIPDAPTAALMTEFYAQMQQGQDKAQALRQAMLTTMKSHPDPGDWAAFTLIGEAN